MAPPPFLRLYGATPNRSPMPPSLRQQVICGVVGFLVQERQAIAGAQPRGMQLLQVCFLQWADVEANALAVLGDLGTADVGLGRVHFRTAIGGLVNVRIGL